MFYQKLTEILNEKLALLDSINRIGNGIIEAQNQIIAQLGYIRRNKRGKNRNSLVW
jgi:hypothetical protein